MTGVQTCALPILTGVEGDVNALGYFGFAYYAANMDALKIVPVDSGAGCVTPSFETIADGTYPLSRSLYIYVNKAKAKENPTVVQYVDFYLGDGTLTKVFETVPYVALPDADLAATRAAWDAVK